MERVDVTVIGGGPTGLFVALLLQQLNISVRVLGKSFKHGCMIMLYSDSKTDEKPSTLELGRADALNARTQQYFEVAGILNDLLPHGLKCNSKNFQPFQDSG